MRCLDCHLVHRILISKKATTRPCCASTPIKFPLWCPQKTISAWKKYFIKYRVRGPFSVTTKKRLTTMIGLRWKNAQLTMLRKFRGQNSTSPVDCMWRPVGADIISRCDLLKSYKSNDDWSTFQKQIQQDDLDQGYNTIQCTGCSLYVTVVE